MGVAEMLTPSESDTLSSSSSSDNVSAGKYEMHNTSIIVIKLIIKCP